MKLFKHLAIFAAIAVGGLGTAYAAPVEEDTTFVLQNVNGGMLGVDIGLYPIDNLGVDFNGIPVQARVAGDTFVDDFILGVNDAQKVSFYGITGFPNGLPAVQFSSVTLYDFGLDVYTFSSSILAPYGFIDSGLTLQSGTYFLEVTGSILQNGGEYSGNLETVPVVSSVSSVPEPANAALMLGALGAMGMLARRRSKR